jgi:hypothetical protein
VKAKRFKEVGSKRFKKVVSRFQISLGFFSKEVSTCGLFTFGWLWLPSSLAEVAPHGRCG